MEGKRVCNAAIEELDQMFRRIYMLVGLRPQFAPNDIDTLFLYQFLQENYKNHTIQEIELAFKKVATGQLTNSDNTPIELYDYFTPAFFGKVMRSYRAWASETGNVIADQIYIKTLKQIDVKRLEENGGEPVDWREVIETDYQIFISGKDTSDTYPQDHYKTLVEDGFIQEDFWRKRLDSCKNKILQNLNSYLVTLQSSRDLDGNEMWMRYNQTLNLINEYKEGKRDIDFEIAAKQSVIASFFRHNQKLGNKNIYAKSDK